MSVYIPVDLRRQVGEQFAGCCAYCRTYEHLTVVTFEVEHIMPLAAGGATILENLCLACPTCNRCKWIHQQARDPETDQQVALFHPQREKWGDHFRWDESGAELIGLTPTGRATIAALRINRPQLIRLRRMWVKLGEHP